MSNLKSLYQGNKEGVTVNKYLKASAPSTLGDGIESGPHLKALKEKRDYFLPPVNYSDPKNFAKFGSAYQYYKNAFEYIANYYPYDGSSLEKTNFYNDINPLEKYALEVFYPRSTGYITIGAEYGTVVSNSSGYFGSSTTQYLQAKGGPHSGTIFSEAQGRTSNLEFGGPSGSCVEFFFKKNNLIDADGFLSASSRRQVILDVTNGQTDSTVTDYGRMTIEIISGSETQFNVNMLSGTFGFSNVLVPTTTDAITISDGNWRNFGFVFNTDESTPTLDFYVNGKCVETGIAGTGDGSGAGINEVTGTMIANLGALRQSPAAYSGLSEGDGKLSASLDEFRFWKEARNAEKIGRHWFTNIEGGSNKSEANVGLGVYFKFNEGITLTSSIDQLVLDYSGRLSNGLFTGYNSTYSRNTGSAIDDLSLTSISERGDPIIRTFNPEYIGSKARYQQSGSQYDFTNNARLLNHLPNWVVEEDENNEEELINITQIISSYFDTLYNQLTALRELKYTTYNSGTLTDSIDTFPHNDRLIENMGLDTPELFENIGVLEQFFKRDEQIDFDQQLVDIKNSIYKNIYNNLNYILKSKGNVKSIRNFIRCLGVGEEILALNIYSDNGDYELSSSYMTGVSTKKYIDFTSLINQDDNNAVVYQYYDSSNPNSVGLIAEETDTKQFAFTLQSEFVFPNRQNVETFSYEVPQSVSASLYGFHTPEDTSSTSTDLTWAASDDDYGFQVYAVKSPGSYAEIISPSTMVKDAYFIVKNRQGETLLTSSIYRNVYDSQRWNFSLTLKPKKYPFADGVLGADAYTSGYELGFCGFNYDTGVRRNSFSVTTDLSYGSGSNTITSAKRVYVGAERTDFTGAPLVTTDVRAASTRYWSDYLSPNIVDLQAKEVDSHGVLRPNRNAYLFQTSSANVYVPQIQTLALSWEFAKVTGSNDSGRFLVPDASSGSVGKGYESEYQGSVFSDINLRQHTGRGDFFTANGTPARKEYVYADKLLPPQYMSITDSVKVLSTDDELFGTFIKPVNNYYAVEKSMYRSISTRMLHLFASIEQFNNLIGEPVNKYRLNYKKMEKIREIFFRKVQNDIPDLQKYLDYYKWLDTSMGQIIQQLFPMSADYAPEVRNVIESHTLERNKVRYQYPIIKDARPWGNRVGPLGLLGGDPAPLGVGGDPHNPVSHPSRRPRRPNNNEEIAIPDLGGEPIGEAGEGQGQLGQVDPHFRQPGQGGDIDYDPPLDRPPAPPPQYG